MSQSPEPARGLSVSCSESEAGYEPGPPLEHEPREASQSPGQREGSPERGDAIQKRSPSCEDLPFERSRSRSGPPQIRDREPARRNNRRGSGEPIPSLLVRHLNRETSPGKLREAFSRYGIIKDVYIPLDYNSGLPKGFGFVEFASFKDAQTAMHEMDGKRIDGFDLRITEAQDRRKSPTAMCKEMSRRNKGDKGKGEGKGGGKRGGKRDYPREDSRRRDGRRGQPYGDSRGHNGSSGRDRRSNYYREDSRSRRPEGRSYHSSGRDYRSRGDAYRRGGDDSRDRPPPRGYETHRHRSRSPYYERGADKYSRQRGDARRRDYYDDRRW